LPHYDEIMGLFQLDNHNTTHLSYVTQSLAMRITNTISSHNKKQFGVQ